jgi:hypothetical protein
MPTQRKYAATRIKAGDYLVPSNDATRIWRFTSYEDTGARIEMRSKTAGVLLINPPARTRWQAHRYRLTVKQLDALGEELPNDFLDFDNWEYDSGDYPTRAAAMKAVL